MSQARDVAVRAAFVKLMAMQLVFSNQFEAG
jgi:hypothetical protein